MGWNAHNENFLSESDILSKLKLRVSYGLTGAENFNVGNVSVNAWPYLAQLTGANAIVGNSISGGNSPLNIVNSLLQWKLLKNLIQG